MAEKFGGDVAAILEDARKRQEASGIAIWQGSSSEKVLNPTGEQAGELSQALWLPCWRTRPAQPPQKAASRAQ